MTIEHKGNYDDDMAGFYVERPEFVSSVAFWYQTGAPKRFAELPPWQQRRVPWQQQHLVRTFLTARIDRRGQGRGADAGILRRTSAAVLAECRNRARLTLPFTVDEDGNYAVRLTALQGPQYGRYEILIDDQRVGEGDFRARPKPNWICRSASAHCPKDPTQLIFQALDAAATGEQPTAQTAGCRDVASAATAAACPPRSQDASRSPLRAAGNRPGTVRLSTGLWEAA